jgi:hypothetical protein
VRNLLLFVLLAFSERALAVERCFSDAGVYGDLTVATSGPGCGTFLTWHGITGVWLGNAAVTEACTFFLSTPSGPVDPASMSVLMTAHSVFLPLYSEETELLLDGVPYLVTPADIDNSVAIGVDLIATPAGRISAVDGPPGDGTGVVTFGSAVSPVSDVTINHIILVGAPAGTIYQVCADDAPACSGPGDADLDGVFDDCDQCPLGDDGLDVDLDQVADACDNCPGGDDLTDSDGDGVPDDCDLCLLGDDALDGDLDGLPDACDACLTGDDALDADLDSVPDACDACPGANDLADMDGDGMPDGCDPCPPGDNADADANGLADGCELHLDWLSPKRGPNDGGVSTSIIGGEFDASCVAWFDGTAAPTTWVDAATLTAEPPAHAVGLGDVEVRCDWRSGGLVGAYTWYDPARSTAEPVDVQTALPSSIDVAGGVQVTVAGTGFAFGSTVAIDGVPVAAELIDDGLIRFVAPRHAPGLVDLAVATPAGAGDTLVGALLYVRPPEGVKPAAEEPAAPAGGSRGPTTGGCDTGGAGPVGGWIALAAFAGRGGRRAGRGSARRWPASSMEWSGSKLLPLDPSDVNNADASDSPWTSGGAAHIDLGPMGLGPPGGRRGVAVVRERGRRGWLGAARDGRGSGPLPRLVHRRQG